MEFPEGRLDEYHFQILKDRESLRKTRESLHKCKVELENVGLLKRQVALICELDEFIYPIVQVSEQTLTHTCFGPFNSGPHFLFDGTVNILFVRSQ